MALNLPFHFLETPPILHQKWSQHLLHLPSRSQLSSPAAAQPSTQSLLRRHRRHRRRHAVASVGKEETEMRVSSVEDAELPTFSAEQQDPSPEDLEYIRQIQRVLELLKKSRDMPFAEVRLIIMIEDPRDAERKRLLGIEDPDGLTRDELVTALEEVHEGKIPQNRIALRMLAEELNQWPNLEVEVPKAKRRKSLYAKATDTGVDPREAAKRLNIDWDSAVDIEPEEDEIDEMEVPPAVGYSALYLVTALPVIIGISVVLILFYNSLQ